MTISRLLAAAALCLSGAVSLAADFKTVGAAPAILYDTPSVKGAKLFVAPRGMPLEVILSYGDWVKVRDVSGDLAWTEARNLSNRRHALARTPNLKVRGAPDDAAAPLFIADKGVLLDVTEAPAAGWIKVRHKDGAAGYVRTGDLWGI